MGELWTYPSGDNRGGRLGRIEADALFESGVHGLPGRCGGNLGDGLRRMLRRDVIQKDRLLTAEKPLVLVVRFVVVFVGCLA